MVAGKGSEGDDSRHEAGERRREESEEQGNTGQRLGVGVLRTSRADALCLLR
jgi:hypothetical protein